MTLLRYTAFGLFGLAALAAIGALATEEPIILSGALAAGILGVAFLGGAEALRLLGEIRDALITPKAERIATSVPQVAGLDAARPPRDLNALSAEIDRIKAKA